MRLPLLLPLLAFACAVPGDGRDSPVAEAWVTLPASCEAPSSLPTDPLALTGEVRVTQDGRAGFLEALDVEVVDGIAFVVGMGRMVIADITNPAAPVKLYGPAETEAGKLHRVEPLQAGFLATSQREEGVLLWDVRDPSAPANVATIVGVGMEGLAFAEGRLFVGVRDEGVRVYDVSDPAKPVETGRGGALSGTWELAATGDGWLYAADASMGLVPFDVSDPDRPAMGSPLTFDGGVLHARYADDRVYVSLGSAGIAVVDVLDRSAPVDLGRFETGGSVVMTDVAEGRLWAVDHRAVTVFDLATGLPIQQDLVEQFSLAVSATGNRAVVGDWNLIEVWSLGEGSAPALDLVDDVRHANGAAEVTLTNRGGADLSLLGASADDDDAIIEVSGALLPPGESAVLRVSGLTTDTQLCLASNDPDGPTRPVVMRAAAAPPAGVAAPDFALVDLDGTTRRLSEQLGNPVLLVYFATW
jgi:hypothetical protein